MQTYISELLKENTKDLSIIKSLIVISLVIFASLIAPKLPPSYLDIIDNMFVKFLLFTGIAYLATCDLVSAIIATIAVIVTLQTLSVHKITNKIIDETKTILNNNLQKLQQEQTQYTESNNNFVIDFTHSEKVPLTLNSQNDQKLEKNTYSNSVPEIKTQNIIIENQFKSAEDPYLKLREFINEIHKTDPTIDVNELYTAIMTSNTNLNGDFVKEIIKNIFTLSSYNNLNLQEPSYSQVIPNAILNQQEPYYSQAIPDVILNQQEPYYSQAIPDVILNQQEPSYSQVIPNAILNQQEPYYSQAIPDVILNQQQPYYSQVIPDVMLNQQLYYDPVIPNVMLNQQEPYYSQAIPNVMLNQQEPYYSQAIPNVMLNQQEPYYSQVIPNVMLNQQEPYYSQVIPNVMLNQQEPSYSQAISNVMLNQQEPSYSQAIPNVMLNQQEPSYSQAIPNVNQNINNFVANQLIANEIENVKNNLQNIVNQNQPVINQNQPVINQYNIKGYLENNDNLLVRNIDIKHPIKLRTQPIIQKIEENNDPFGMLDGNNNYTYNNF